MFYPSFPVFHGNQIVNDRKVLLSRNTVAKKCRHNDKIRQSPSCNPYCKNGSSQSLKIDAEIIGEWLMRNLQREDHVDTICVH